VKSINAFAVSAVVEKARTIIAQEKHFLLSEEEACTTHFFYEIYGFRPLMRHPYKLFMTIADIRKTMGKHHRKKNRNCRVYTTKPRSHCCS
jgi:hypothetical protein